MRWLIFLSRVGFLAGVVMLFALSLGYISLSKAESTFAMIVLMGYGLAAILLPLINLTYLILALINRKRLRLVPVWLVLSNIAFLIIFLIFTFYINDPYYNR